MHCASQSPTGEVFEKVFQTIICVDMNPVMPWSGTQWRRPGQASQIPVTPHLSRLGHPSVLAAHTTRPGCRSTVDNVARPSIFVTYHDNQCYPEYLIAFK